MSVGDKSVIFLIGAGCSYDAGIPMSNTMIKEIEDKLADISDWGAYRDLYDYVKHTILYGNMRNKVQQDFNIESLLVTLHALAEHRKSILYPFISGYSNDLIEYAGRNFSKIEELIVKIEAELPKWVTKSDYLAADYYKGFSRFQQESNYTVRIFSLNYDLCVEKQITEGLECGFGEGRPWDGSRFIHTNDEESDAPVYLYKLHGSIDWERNDNVLIRSQRQGIKPDIVFGTSVKMQAVDPYLFYLYEFRRYALAAQVVVAIGYSFNDAHINDLLKQSLETDESRRLLVVNPAYKDIYDINEKLGLANLEKMVTQIIVSQKGAKDFLTSDLSVDYISGFLPKADLPF